MIHGICVVVSTPSVSCVIISLFCSPQLLVTFSLSPSFYLSIYLTLTHFLSLSLSQVRTRLMNQPADARLYTGAIDCFMKLIAKDGVKGLYAGELAREES